MKLEYTYTLEIGDRFLVNGAIHEVGKEYIINQEGKVVVSIGGSQFGMDVDLANLAARSKISIRSEKIMEELNSTGSHADIQFIYPGDPHHLANKNIAATICDTNSPEISETFDVGLWFINTRTTAVKELHAGSYRGGPALAHIGGFYRNINPRINRFFYAGSKPEIVVDAVAVEAYLNRAAPVLTGKLKFTMTDAERAILAAR